MALVKDVSLLPKRLQIGGTTCSAPIKEMLLSALQLVIQWH